MAVLLIFFSPGTDAQTGTTWTSRTSAGNSVWTSVVYGNGKFVAVGNNGGTQCVMTSPDGISWTLQTAISGAWSSVSFGNNTFVAVAYGSTTKVMTSPDGITWTNHTPSAALSNTWNSVTFGNGLFVAVADGGNITNEIMTSPDGITWTARIAAAKNSWTTIAYGNNRFVAVAYSGNGTANQVMTSPDGITWTGHTSTADIDWAGVTWGNNEFVAVAQNGSNLVMTSPDGITWTSRTAPSTAWNAITYGNNLFVAVSFFGTGNRVMTSADGITWTIRASAADNSWSGITFANGIFVAVSGGPSATSRVMTSGTFVPLPVHWLDAKGNVNDAGRVNIEWSVDEQSIKGYDVEKSMDGINYTKIGSLYSKGVGEHNYGFMEQQVLTSSAWYRIKQTDFDGHFSYSTVIILYSNIGNYKIIIYPNPVNGLATITVDKKSLNKTARIINLQGKTLQAFEVNNLSFTVNLANYPAGLYLLKIENEGPLKIIKE